MYLIDPWDLTPSYYITQNIICHQAILLNNAGSCIKNEFYIQIE